MSFAFSKNLPLPVRSDIGKILGLDRWNFGVVQSIGKHVILVKEWSRGKFTTCIDDNCSVGATVHLRSEGPPDCPTISDQLAQLILPEPFSWLIGDAFVLEWSSSELKARVDALAISLQRWEPWIVSAEYASLEFLNEERSRTLWFHSGRGKITGVAADVGVDVAKSLGDYGALRAVIEIPLGATHSDVIACIASRIPPFIEGVRSTELERVTRL